jgi:YtkA-like
MRISIAVLTAAMITWAVAPNGYAAGRDYRFELAGAPQKDGKGTSLVSVKLVHLPDNKPVPGAVLIQSRADMGPIGMAAMTAPVKALPEQPAGTYRLEVQNESVWKKADNWALTLDAKVQGEPETVHGSVIVKLEP